MIGAFTTLLMAVGSKGIEPSNAITTLVRGGLSTALVSSLISAIMASIVMCYLSFTERNIVDLKEGLNNVCLEKYQNTRNTNQKQIQDL